MNIQFDQFELRTDVRALYEDGAQRSVEPQVFDILVYLVINRDRIIGKSELVREIWSDRAISDAAINSRIRSARQAIGDNGRDQKFIKTVHGRGFRFVSDVTIVETVATSEAASMPVSANVQSTPPPAQERSKGKKLPLSLVAACSVLVIAFFAAWTWLSPMGNNPETGSAKTATGPETIAPSIAVLPFADLSETPEKDALAEGFTEELLNVLAQNPGLRVSSRTSASILKERGLTIPEMAEVLDVDHVVEGSIRFDEDKVRITVQMIEGETDRHFWSRHFDADPRNASFIDLQSDIASAISEQLAVTAFTGNVLRPALTRNSEAYQAYLRGVGLKQSSLDEVSLSISIEEFTSAITLDPNFAEAYAARSEALQLLDSFSGSNNVERDRMADEDLAKAEELDPDTIPYLMASANMAQGEARYEDVFALTARALAKDGSNSEAYNLRGLAAFYTADYDTAIDMFTKGLTHDPLSSSMLLMLSESYLMNQDWNKALEIAEQNYRWNRNSIEAMAPLIGLYQHFDRHADGYAVMMDIRNRFPKDSFSAVYGGWDIASVSADPSIIKQAKTDLERASMSVALGDDLAASDWLRKADVFTFQSMILAGFIGDWQLVRDLSVGTPFFELYADGTPMDSDAVMFDLVANLVDKQFDQPRYAQNREALVEMFSQLEVGDLESQDAMFAAAWLSKHGMTDLALDYIENAATEQFFYYDGFRKLSIFAELRGKPRFEMAFDRVEENRRKLSKEVDKA